MTFIGANIINKHKEDPGWAEVICLYSGLFETEKEREEFIVELASTNIYLSAECKLTSINDEDVILDQLIEKAFYSFRDKNDYLSLLTLLTLNEYFIVADLFNYKYGSKIDDRIAIMAILNKADSFAFISSLDKYLPKEIYNKIIQFIASNVSEKNKNYYLLLIKNISEELVDEVYFEIKNSVFNTDEEILALLLKKCSEKRGYDLYCEIERDIKIPGVAVINSLLIVSDSHKVFLYYKEFERHKLKPNLATLNIILHKYYTNKPYQVITDLAANLNLEITITNVKKFQRISTNVILFYDNYQQIKACYENLILMLKVHFESEVAKDSELKIITHLIKNSENFNTAKYWYCLAVQKYYELNGSKTLIQNFLYKFDNHSAHIFVTSNIEDIIFKHRSIKVDADNHIQKYYGHLFKNLPHEHLYFETYYHLLNRMIDLDITIPIQVPVSLIERFNENKELVYLCSILIESPEMHPKILTSLLIKLPLDVSLLVIKILKEKAYELSIIHYNTILNKNKNYELSMKLLTDIESSFLKPDKFTFTNLIPTCHTPDQLIDVICQCAKYNVEFDSYLEFAISSTLAKMSKSDYCEEFKNRSGKLYLELNVRYFNLLNTFYHKCSC